jgi:hypothetical protein
MVSVAVTPATHDHALWLPDRIWDSSGDPYQPAQALLALAASPPHIRGDGAIATLLNRVGRGTSSPRVETRFGWTHHAISQPSTDDLGGLFPPVPRISQGMLLTRWSVPPC